MVKKNIKKCANLSAMVKLITSNKGGCINANSLQGTELKKIQLFENKNYDVLLDF
jgi:hypothetical protein